MKAARIVKVNEPLQVQELQTPKPKGPQTLINLAVNASRAELLPCIASCRLGSIAKALSNELIASSYFSKEWRDRPLPR
jgi:hypothetical protein